MAVNTMSIEQANVIMTALYQQATGNSIAATDAADFVTMAQTTLRTGYDTVMSALSQVLTKTIFSIRPYSGKFNGVEVDSERWGAVTRKINFLDTPLEADSRLTLTDGQSIDQYVVQKPKALETRFYGANQYQKHITIFRDQLDVAFSSEAEFARFISGVLQNIEDQLEQVREGEARLALLNYFAARYQMGANTERAINVLSAFNAANSGSVASFEDLISPVNITPFVKWFYAKVATDSDRMSNRTKLYHENITGKEVMRHSPVGRTKLFMIGDIFHDVDASVKSSIFNPQYLKLRTLERVPFWQAFEKPYEINFKGNVMNLTTGDYAAMESAVNFNGLAILYDEDALGIVRKSSWMQASPFNARGGYYNLYWHVTFQSWNDLTENAIIYYAPKSEG